MRVFLLTAFLTLSLAGQAAMATDRVALLIANDVYGDERLPAASTSADFLVAPLRELGFRITRLENLDSKAIETGIRDFADSVPTNGIAVIYFAGFGGQVKSKSKAHPDRWVSAIHSTGAVKDSGTILKNSIPLEKLREWAEKTGGARQSFLFLDCAVNPYHNSDLPLGLAEVSPAEVLDGTAVAMSAAPGEEAVFPRSGPSDFARSVATALKSRDLGALPWQQAFPGIQGEAIEFPGKLERRFLDSESIRDGEFAGQEWVSPFAAVFCWCPPGKFTFGDAAFDDAEPVEAEISRGYWMQKYEFAQRERWLMANRGPKAETILVHRLAPVVHVKHNEASGFVKKLNQSEQNAGRLPAGWEYALPTEAEWEYACRAGSSTAYCFGEALDELDRYANFADRRLLEADDTYHWAYLAHDDGIGLGPALIGSYQPNAWGIHDMHGNLNEWTADLYLPELTGGRNPAPPDKVKDVSDRVFRGGAWCSLADYCRSGFRNFAAANANAQTDQFTGFRLVLKPVSKK